MTPADITADRIARRLAATAEAEDGPTGDQEINPGWQPPDALAAAAVLVPLMVRDEGLTVLLTMRPSTMTRHAGQISFPGGRIDPGDADAVAAALREMEEEVGVVPDAVQVLGRLRRYRTVTGFDITPVVGLVRPPVTIRPDPREVEAVFEVPLAFVLDPANHRRDSRPWHGVRRHYYVITYDGWRIWGATAAMLVHLAKTLATEAPECSGAS